MKFVATKTADQLDLQVDRITGPNRSKGLSALRAS